MNRRIFLTAAGMTAIGGWPMRAWSEEAYPLPPDPAGAALRGRGPTDTTSRIIAARLSQVLGQSVVVEARPGAGGTLAAEMITRAPPGGYTLLYTSAGLASAAALYKNLRFDPRKDLTAVGRTIDLLDPARFDGAAGHRCSAAPHRVHEGQSASCHTVRAASAMAVTCRSRRC